MSPILRDVPLQFETERLFIRCPQPGDGATMHASMLCSLPALRAFPGSVPWALVESSVGAWEKFCREAQADYLLRNRLPMLLFLKDSGAHVGHCSVFSLVWTVPKGEIGYWANSDFARQGLMTEAVKGITDFAFEHLGLRRIEAFPDDENEASWRVCERAGYVYESTLRNERAAPDGTLRNTRLYSAIR
jgi:hypothetical protein